MGQQAIVMEALRAGAKDFVLKPFQPDRVLGALQSRGDGRRERPGHSKHRRERADNRSRAKTKPQAQHTDL